MNDKTAEEILSFSYQDYVDDVLNGLEGSAIEDQVYAFAWLLREVQSDSRFADLFDSCMLQTRTPQALPKLMRRYARAQSLLVANRMTAEIQGATAECGVYMGFSSLLMFRYLAFDNPTYRGEDFHLIDSFEGLSELTVHDATSITKTSDEKLTVSVPKRQGHMSCSIEHVRSVLNEIAGAKYFKGWIPEVLTSLPDQKYKFVHIDVDLYEPTFACLEYFVPRMTEGGIILNDDYYSLMFPGGGRAWKEYCDQHQINYLPLDSGQAVMFC